MKASNGSDPNQTRLPDELRSGSRERKAGGPAAWAGRSLGLAHVTALKHLRFFPPTGPPSPARPTIRRPPRDVTEASRHRPHTRRCACAWAATDRPLTCPVRCVVVSLVAFGSALAHAFSFAEDAYPVVYHSRTRAGFHCAIRERRAEGETSLYLPSARSPARPVSCRQETRAGPAPVRWPHDHRPLGAHTTRNPPRVGRPIPSSSLPLTPHSTTHASTSGTSSKDPSSLTDQILPPALINPHMHA